MADEKVQFKVVMFIDIPTATHIRESEGPTAERAFLDRCVSLLSVVRKQHEGVLVRIVGSTLLCTFATADNAIQASVGMNEAVTRGFEDSLIPPSLRIGMQAGDVTIKRGGCSGDVVTTAARIVTLARPHQVLTTETVHAQVTPRFQHRLTPLENAKAMEGRLNVRLFEVAWEKPLVSSDAEDRSRTAVMTKQPPPQPTPQPQAQKPQIDRIPLGNADEPTQAEPTLRPPSKQQAEVHTTEGLEFTTATQELTPKKAPPVLRGAPLVDFGGGTGPSFLPATGQAARKPSLEAEDKPQSSWIVSPLEEDGGAKTTPPSDGDMAPVHEESAPAPSDSNFEQIATAMDSAASLRTNQDENARGEQCPVPLAKRPAKRRIILKEIVEKAPAAAQPQPAPAAAQPQPAPAAAQPQPAPAAAQPQPMASPQAQDTKLLRLCLIIHQKVILVDSGRPKISMGRDESNDVIIGVGTSSRRHAEVVLKDGAFYLIDHSWNGTYLYDENGHETLVHNDELVLTRGGVICPGCPGDVDGVEAIRFVLAS